MCDWILNILHYFLCQYQFYIYSDYGIVISISIWQWLLEFFTKCLINGCLLAFKEHGYNLLEFLLLSSYCLNYVILPPFYLIFSWFKIQEFFLSKGKFKVNFVSSETKLWKEFNWIWNEGHVLKYFTVNSCFLIFLWKYLISIFVLWINVACL